MRRALATVLAVTVALAVCGSTSGCVQRAETTSRKPTQKPVAVWPMSGCDAQHTQRSRYSGPKRPELKWIVGPDTGDWWVLQSTPVIDASGTVLARSSSNELAVTRPGRQLWLSPTLNKALGAAIGADGTVYVGTHGTMRGSNPPFDTTVLVALRSDGSRKWQVLATGTPTLAAPTIGADGTVYVAGCGDGCCPSGAVYAIDPSGVAKWRADTPVAPLLTAPALGKDGTVYDSLDGLCARTASGTVKWKLRGLHGDLAIGPDGTVYCVDGRVLTAVSVDGKRKWATQVVGRDKSWTTPLAVALDGTVYAGSWDGRFVAVNPDGTVKWELKFGPAVWVAPAIGADGTVYVALSDDKLCALSPDGKKKWEYDTGQRITSSLAIGKGVIYFSTGDGRLAAVGEKGE